jgi:hypothetical protein
MNNALRRKGKFSVEFETFKGIGFAIGYAYDDVHEEYYFGITILCFSIYVAKEK